MPEMPRADLRALEENADGQRRPHPKEHPDAITPNLATNNVSQKFTKDRSPSSTEASGSNAIYENR